MLTKIVTKPLKKYKIDMSDTALMLSAALPTPYDETMLFKTVLNIVPKI